MMLDLDILNEAAMDVYKDALDLLLLLPTSLAVEC